MEKSLSLFIYSVFFISVLALLAGCQRPEESVTKVEITQWKMREAGANEWQTAKVPGNNFLDLLNAGVIQNPFRKTYEDSVQWISERDWEYLAEFSLTNLNRENDVCLVFDGLDTYADVFLNDSLILKADNMFRQWEVQLSSQIIRDTNRLRVYFHSPLKVIREKEKYYGTVLPDIRGFVRKAPYQFGWDWGPRLICSGIWKPVKIVQKEGAVMESIAIRTLILNDSVAKLRAGFEIWSPGERKISISCKNAANTDLLLDIETTVPKGKTRFSREFVIDDPDMWWPNGWGEPHLYRFNFKLHDAGFVNTKEVSYGLRTVELITEPDSVGESFYFKVNGKPLFVKGANYIPQHNFPSLVDTAIYKAVIADVVASNMNMLRVWGGGIYEKDLFYDLCDRNGVLVWQDFMFACNMYPGDPGFVENVNEEARQQVERLRNHACLALWCGNNEVDEGWHNWGWQKQLGYDAEDSTKLWNAYQRIFHDVLPAVVQELDSGRPYHPSSPKIGWGRPESMTEGDSHYWGVWWGAQPFEVYEEKVPRFMSEFGFQAFPDMKTIEWFAGEDKLYLESEAMAAHQKHPRGFELIETYMQREYNVPDNFEDYVYVSQLVQAGGIGRAIEAHRHNMPRCMGTLYWQLNDCWPVISWSGRDYFGRWKALQYKVRELYRPVILSAEQADQKLKVCAISDRLDSINTRMEICVMDFSGKTVFEYEKEIPLSPLSSEIVFAGNIQDLIDPDQMNKAVLVARLFQNNHKIAEKLHYFVKPKDLKLPTPEIEYSMMKADTGYFLTIFSAVLAKNVFLSDSTNDAFFQDNYFDLLPGEERRIGLVPGDVVKSVDDFNLGVKSLRSTLYE